MDDKAKRIQTLIARAQPAGLRVDVSGSHKFIHGKNVTIRILPNGMLSSNQDPDQTRPRNLTINEASKLLKLPRR